jgi:sterol desaturase/sphingolipid hydroxylase (fatty acid hydroxylase superfamily)
MTLAYVHAFFLGYWTPALWFYMHDMRMFTVFTRIDDMDPKELHALYATAAPHVLCNQLVLHFPILFYVYAGEGVDWVADAYRFVLVNGVNAALFSVIHHLLHHPLVYARVHKFHHQHVHTVAVTSQYNHPVEEFLTWTVSTWAPLLVWPLSHEATLVYCAMHAAYGVVGHAGYRIPGIEEDIVRHNIHHKLFTPSSI